MLVLRARWIRLSAGRTLRALGVILAFSLPVYYLVGGLLFNFVQSRFLEETLAGKYTSGRPQLLQETSSLFWSQPAIGVGLDGYYGKVGSVVGVSYPHNLVAAVAAEGGILGLLLLGNVFVRWGKTFRRAAPLTLDTRSCIVGAVFVFSASMFSGDYYDARFGWIFLLLGSVSAAQDFAERAGAADRPPARDGNPQPWAKRPGRSANTRGNTPGGADLLAYRILPRSQADISREAVTSARARP